MRAELVEITEDRRRAIVAHLDGIPDGVDGLGLMQHFAITHRMLKRDLESLFAAGLVGFYRNGPTNRYAASKHLEGAKMRAKQVRAERMREYDRGRMAAKNDRRRKSGPVVKPAAWPMPAVSVWHFAQQVAA